MYVTIKKTTLNTVSQDKSLREMLNELLIESDVAVTAVAEEIGINKDSFSEYLKGNYELKLTEPVCVGSTPQRYHILAAKIGDAHFVGGYETNAQS